MQALAVSVLAIMACNIMTYPSEFDKRKVPKGIQGNLSADMVLTAVRLQEEKTGDFLVQAPAYPGRPKSQTS